MLMCLIVITGEPSFQEKFPDTAEEKVVDTSNWLTQH